MSFLDDYAEYAHWLLRLGLASVFLFHGVSKAMAGAGHPMVASMGMPMIVFILVTFAELAGGAGIIIGGLSNSFITRLSGLAIIPVMSGAIVMVHGSHWHFNAGKMGGMEFQVVLLLVAVYFLIVGNNESNSVEK